MTRVLNIPSDLRNHMDDIFQYGTSIAAANNLQEVERICKLGSVFNAGLILVGEEVGT